MIVFTCMYKIEKLNPKSKIELQKLTEIIKEFYIETYSQILKKEIINYLISFVKLDTVKNKIDIGECELLFIKENENIIGFLELKKEQNIIRIIKFYIFKEKRNKGIGTLILNNIFKINKKENFEIHINEKLDIAQKFFIQKGFKYQNKIIKYIGEDYFLYEKKYFK